MPDLKQCIFRRLDFLNRSTMLHLKYFVILIHIHPVKNCNAISYVPSPDGTAALLASGIDIRIVAALSNVLHRFLLHPLRHIQGIYRQQNIYRKKYAYIFCIHRDYGESRQWRFGRSSDIF
jgi:hypothetical protein